MSMLKAAWEAIMRMFTKMSNGTNSPSEQVIVAEGTEAPLTEEEVAVSLPGKTISPKKPRVQRAKELVSIGALLESLDETFDALRLPFGKLSWISRSHAVGLRKLGIHVVHPAYQDAVVMSAITVPSNRILPAMLCVGFGDSRFDGNERVYPAVVFAVKENKLPAEVSRCAGQHYLFGAGFKVGATSENDHNKKLFWLAGYMTVRADGSLYLHQELKPRQHTIHVSNPATRRAVGKTIAYTTKAWGKASLAQLYDEATQAEGTRLCITQFASAMNWWIAREENWSVAVKKDGERITFAIPKELTARFFENRIKVTNENGVTKRIIHYVKSHDRATGDGKTTVKAHIRGLDEFDWNGYGCHVTAPKFNGVLSTEFTLEATTFEDGEKVPEKRFVDISKVGAVLARMEEGVTQWRVSA